MEVVVRLDSWVCSHNLRETVVFRGQMCFHSRESRKEPTCLEYLPSDSHEFGHIICSSDQQNASHIDEMSFI
jgi:hypothetical protein